MNRESRLKVWVRGRPFRIALLFILVVWLFISASSLFENAASNAELASSEIGVQSDFRIEALERMAEGPLQWVTAGKGVLLYGAGEQVYVAPEETPDLTIASLAFDHPITEALILGRLAFLGEEDVGMRLLDLEDPASPVDLGAYDLPGTSFHIAHWGGFLFIGGDDGGVRVLEVMARGSEPFPHAPEVLLKERGFFSIGEPITAMTITPGGRAYVATGDRIRVFDLLDLSDAVQTDTLPVTMPVKSMVVRGDQLFIAAGTEGMYVLDISIPGSAAILGKESVPAESLYPAGRKIYIGGSEGLQVVSAGPTAAATFDVQIVDFAFVPGTVNITKGDTVRWTWLAGGHSTTSGAGCVANGIWNSGVLGATSTFSHTFNSAGSFPYFCIPHCALGMVGTVQVAALPPGISMSVNPSPVNFGKAEVGQSSDQVITIKNAPTSIGPLTGNVGAPSPPFSLLSGGGAFTLNPGQKTSVILRFSPSMTGLSSGTLGITHNANNQTSPTNLQLSGRGAASPVPMADLVLSSFSGPSTGVIGKTITLPNTVTNQGTAAANNVVVKFFISDVPNMTPDARGLGKRFLLKVPPGASKGPANTSVVLPSGLAPGSYFIGAVIDPGSKVRESDKTNNTTFDLNGIVVCSSLSAPTALSPAAGATNVSTTPTLDWSNVSGASTYEVEIATDRLFTNVVRSMSGLTASEWTVDPALAADTKYFWRARAANECLQGPRSIKRKFTTAP